MLTVAGSTDPTTRGVPCVEPAEACPMRYPKAAFPTEPRRSITQTVMLRCETSLPRRRGTPEGAPHAHDVSAIVDTPCHARRRVRPTLKRRRAPVDAASTEALT